MKAATLAALIAFGFYLLAGLIASALTDGLTLWLLGGGGLWLAFRAAYAMEDALNG